MTNIVNVCTSQPPQETTFPGKRRREGGESEEKETLLTDLGRLVLEKEELQRRYANLETPVCSKRLKLVLDTKLLFDHRREEFNLRWEEFERVKKPAGEVPGCPDCRVTLSSPRKRY